MQPEQVEVKRWLLKAQHDESVAPGILAADGEETDVAAFPCQQAVEKTLKAYPMSRDIEFEKIHDLGRLLDHCAADDEGFESLRDAVEPLTLFAITFRYPGPADPSREDVASALDVVAQVRAFVRERLPGKVLP